MRRPAGPNLPRPRRTERAASARPAEPLCKAAKPPSYLSYSSYWSYRGIREEVHLASNQYGPGKMANFPCSAKTPVRAKPDGPTPVALRANRSLTAPAAHRLRALSFSREHHRSPIGTSQTCRRCRENFSLPGRGAAPHTLPILLSLPLSNQSACASTPKICKNLRNLRFLFWQSCRRQPAPNRLQSAKSAVPPSYIFVVLRGPLCQPRRANLPLSSHRFARRALAARSVAVEGLALRACTLRSLFSVLPVFGPALTQKWPI